MAAEVLLSVSYPLTLQEVMGPGQACPQDDGARLGNSRSDRIRQLELWLNQFEAYKWLKRQPAASGALTSFVVIQKRRKTDAKFADDLALFRFWKLGVFAAMFMDSKFPTQPSADDRTKAVTAAKQLLAVAKRTTLLRDAGIEFPQSEQFRQGLASIARLSVERRKRVDAHADDRLYVQMLAAEADRLFGDVPPSLICAFAALKVKNPDKAAITRRISEYKKARP
ncbi:MAG: hypothetical protein EOP50_00790 [Sphingobacteriales bacterium]|nr:MAG: hypothetical protein EOP50_00790 [Sphingobacteriales bacterium]